MKKATRLIAPTALGVGLVFGAASISANSETVTVESGDTYWGIAQGYDNVTTNQLVEANQYDPTALPVGVELTIPTDGSTGSDSNGDVVTHVIQPGNTLSGIAAVYDGVTVDDLIRLNPEVDPYTLQIGSEIAVVDYEREQGTDYLYHTVQPGNTFNNIAAVYDYVSAEDIMEANPNEDPYSLTIGSRIVIPLN